MLLQSSHQKSLNLQYEAYMKVWECENLSKPECCVSMFEDRVLDVLAATRTKLEGKSEFDLGKV